MRAQVFAAPGHGSPVGGWIPAWSYRAVDSNHRQEFASPTAAEWARPHYLNADKTRESQGQLTQSLMDPMNPRTIAAGNTAMSQRGVAPRLTRNSASTIPWRRRRKWRREIFDASRSR